MEGEAMSRTEPIAVIGMACRLPQAPDPEGFWRLLRDGVDAVTEPPPGRPEAGPEHRCGGFLDAIDGFDAEFFGISPNEAAAMDPQQRLMLELAWESLENARISAAAVRDRHVGVFVGAMSGDYGTVLHRNGPAGITQHTLTGSSRGVIANRISYHLGFRGPSFAVDSGQSSSLLAVHLACESLHDGESELAIAGGVNLNIVPESTVSVERFGGLSPDARCFTFDARANGYVRGEGAGAVVLKPLRRAQEDGDRIHCVVLGSAVNSDGTTGTLTVPSGEAQERVIELATRRAGVRPEEVQYVELHGTGTRVGDPTEAAALGAVLGAGRTGADKLAVGSAKTNVGHLEGAAGIVGLLKTALSIAHRKIPPSLHFVAPSPRIPLDRLGLRVQTGLSAWPRPDSPLVAGVSAFGMGGTNCHVVLGEPPRRRAEERAASGEPLLPWPLSAKNDRALRAQARRLEEFVVAGRRLIPADVGRSLAETRAPLPERAVVLAATRAEFLAGLSAVAQGGPAGEVVRGGPEDRGKLVLVFPGGTAPLPGTVADHFGQETGVGRVFGTYLAACADALIPLTGWSPIDVLRGEPGVPDAGSPDVARSVRWAVAVAHAATLRSCGVRPDAVIGQGEGQVAAACATGRLTLAEGAELIVGGAGWEGVLEAAGEIPGHAVGERADTVLGALIGGGHRVFIEAAAEPVLGHQIRCALDAAGAEGVTVAGTGRSGVLRSVALAYVHGGEIDWPVIFAESGAALIDLPTYAFQRTSHWITPPGAVATAPAAEAWRPELPPAERYQSAVELVRAEAAVVLGHHGAHDVGVQRSFDDLGFDSLTGVQLSRRLEAATGLCLPDTLIFDHPTPAALAGHLLGVAEEPPAPVPGTAGEPIAVVAMACRFPGGVGSPEDLWRLVESGGCEVSEVPADRGWEVSALGGFLADAAGFDADFFGISPREALAMDPQQRLMLEVAWEVLERAGIPAGALAGSDTGVYVGAMPQEYGPRAHEGPEDLKGYLMTGGTGSVVSGRIAYTLGLGGPAVTVDTACSSSLVALHMACQALRLGECGLALAGGVTVMATPEMYTEFGKQRGLAADGRCKAFAAAADGTSWGEGAGLLLLERLSDARRNGHQVLAVIRGSAVNQDGASSGLTAPNGTAQRRVIRAALAAAGLGPADVDAVEAHGTGTTLGDPIEAESLLDAYGRDRPADRPLLLGSVKSNIGHPQAAAGVAGVIKMIMAMRTGLLPRTLHVDQPTPRVDWSSGAVRLLTESIPWPVTGRARRAAVSSFGISGTNAHLVLEETTTPTPPTPLPEPGAAPSPWLVSARTQTALRVQAQRLRDYAAARPDLDHGAVAGALRSGRTVFEHRALVAADDRSGLLSGLAALAAGEPDPRIELGTGPVGGTAFLFAGQGSQRLGMGRELYESSQVFAAALDLACSHLDAHLDRPLREVMWAPAGSPEADLLDQTGYTQPALFALQVALYAMVVDQGLTPDCLLGHSIGEIVAAHLAGVLSMADAAKLVTARGRLMQELRQGGAMVSIRAGEEEIAPLLAGLDDKVGMAAVNGPAAVVLSGDADAVLSVEQVCAGRGWATRRLNVSHAFHSPHMDGMLDGLLEVAGSLSFRPPALTVVSNLTGRVATEQELCSPAYWVRHAREAVRFGDGARRLADLGVTTCLELSADAVLSVLTRAVFRTVASGRGAEPEARPVLQRGRPEPETVSRAIGWARARGAGAVQATGAGLCADLPTYPFERRRYWLAATSGPRPSGPAEETFWAAVDSGDGKALAETLGATGERERAALRTAVPLLSDWRQRRREREATDGRRYRVAWRPITAAATPSPRGTWLLVVPAGYDDDPWVTACAAALADGGADIRWITAVEPGINRDALAGRLSAEGEAPGGVLSLLALDDRPHPPHPGISRGLASTLTLTQALSGTSGRPLWLLTRGAVGTGRTDPVDSPAQAQVWALGRAAALEHPRSWGGMVDVPADTGAAPLLRAALTGPGGEEEIAVRRGGLLGRRLVADARAETPDGRPWQPAGTVLVTGGTGGLGAHVARWLAAAGAEHLVLVSRQGRAAPGATALEAELRGHGTAVTVVSCDVADRAQLTALIATVTAGHGPIRSVFHAAGVGHRIPIGELTLDELAAECSKAAAAAHLDELLGTAELDAFVLFSSIAGIGLWTTTGQAAYAAANAYLDALAERRLARGATATSLAWGLWSGPGMGADPAFARHLGRYGVVAMRPETAIAALRHALDDDAGCLAVAEIDWDRFVPSFTAARPRPLLNELAAVRSVLDTARAGDPPREVAARPSDVPGLVLSTTAAILGDPAGTVDPRRPFRDLGFDSLMAVELPERLAAAIGRELPATLAYDHPTPKEVTDHLVAELTGERPRAADFSGGAPTAGDPVAVVAMACRYPGGVRSPEDLWEALMAGTDAVSEFPADRGWDVDGLYDPAGDRPGTSYTDRGGFLYDAAEFDPAFFDISPREAVAMDPQQRLLLTLAWEAMERAGIDPASVRDSDTGVFIGTWPHQYGGSGVPVSEEVAGHMLTGMAASVSSGRIAYTFGLRGPAVTLDTACSSSLVALHLACQALRSGECGLALVGAATVMATPTVFTEFSRQRGLAPDGLCKPFAAAADGTAWGEGAAMLMLERLSDATRNGHRVLCVVRGSAVNQDGASNGLTAPSGPAQERVIRQALATAGLAPADVDAVEAHGTGTALGDPIEARALLAAYGPGRDSERPLLLGSVKSNIGHTQAAAGMAGLIKLVMAMRHGVLPKTLHIDRPTPHVDWTPGTVRLVTEPVRWPDTGRPRRGGVSSFGISGTNAHLIIEEGPDNRVGGVEAKRAETPVRMPWLVSAKSRTALQAQAGALRDWAVRHPEQRPDDVAYALATTRHSFERRAAVIGGTHAELVEALDRLARGEDGPGVVHRTAGPARTAFLYPAGSTWSGRDLYEAFPVYAAGFEAALAALDVHRDRRRHGAHATRFAADVALTGLLEHLGLRPDHVMGGGSGEPAAVHAAQVLSLSDAAALAAGLDGLTRRAPGDFQALLATLRFNEPAVPLVSGSTGRFVTAGELALPEYWHQRSADGFGKGARLLAESGAGDPLVLGPATAVEDDLAAVESRDRLIPIVRPGQGEADGLVAALAEAYCQGLPVVWEHLFPDGGRPVDLPTYAFERRRFWLRPADQDRPATARQAGERHPLIDAAIELDDGGMLFTGGLSERSQPWIADHSVHGRVVVPGVTFLELAAWAARQTGCAEVTELTHKAPLIVPERGRVEVQMRVGPAGPDGRRTLALRCRDEAGSRGRPWSQLAAGILGPARPAQRAETAWLPVGATPIEVGDFYERSNARGHYGWGPMFQSLRAAYRHGDDLYAELRLPADRRLDLGLFAPHPALLDATMHALGLEGTPERLVSLLTDRGESAERPRIPFIWNGVSMSGEGARELRVRISPAGPGMISITAWDEAGRLVVGVESLVMLPVSANQLGRPSGRRGALYRVAWRSTEPPAVDAGSVVRAADLSTARTMIVAAGRPPAAAVLPLPGSGTDPTAARAAARRTLRLVQDWLADDDLAGVRLVLVTRRAVAALATDQVEDLANAASWGLVRSAQAENPGRFALVDVDGTATSDAAVEAAACTGAPQVAIRNGTLHVPAPVQVPLITGRTGRRIDPEGTVLITGGTGGLGALLARHLVTEHGVRHLILASRRGQAAEGARELAAELAGHGAEAVVTACDTSDRASVAALLDAVPRRLTAVVHAAGVLDDAVVTALTGDQVDGVMLPKADGAWHLHDLTRELDLDAFVLFSSVAGALGTAGQANYAAANGYLDALASLRCSLGLPATSLAWGLWDSAGMGRHLGPADRERIHRIGITPLSAEDGLSLFDDALTLAEPLLMPVDLDLAVRGSTAPAATVTMLPAGLPPGERDARLLDLIVGHVAEVSGHPREAIEADATLFELGLDSLMVVELRNRLAAASGLNLPASIAFDHPTPSALVDHLGQRLAS